MCRFAHEAVGGFTGSSASHQEPTLNDETKRPQHPDLPAEQAYIDAAYARLEEIRAEAQARAEKHASERHTSFQAVYERDVAVQTALRREAALDIGDQSLVFGRIDDENEARHYIGRRAVFDRTFDPLVIDWRVPAAEPFYRATGRHPMGLRLRRHFLSEGRRLLAIEDERFQDGVEIGLTGSGALMAAMERPRTGHMRDIVATIQAEQDEIIRDDLAGILVVQGGPGTGKTAVALHRAAYLLYTYRQKLERQGVLVVGPNRRFLRYIEQVLPSLGEAGVTLATLADLAPDVRLRDEDEPATAEVKGDPRMADVIANAVRLHQRPPGRATTVELDGYALQLSRREIDDLVLAARRNRRTHNARRSMMLTVLVDRLYVRYRRAVKRQHGSLAPELTMRRRDASRLLRADDRVRGLLDEAWPLVSPQQLVSRLLTSRALLTEAAARTLRPEEIEALLRSDPDAWTSADVPLLDEALVHLGAPVERRKVASLEENDDDEPETFGHVIVDEAQDLTPMALRMIARRSRTSSITLVGDLAQAVGATPPASWDDVVAMLRARAGWRVRELTVNYRTPGSVMDVAARILAEAAPELKPPSSARESGAGVRFLRETPELAVKRLAGEHRSSGIGTMAFIAARPRLAALRAAAGADDREELIAVLTPHEAKGLEFDRIVVVEPDEIVTSSPQGLRALYVALTRATHDATVVYADRLPAVLDPGAHDAPPEPHEA